jgi:4-amino-4-deoxy-L-arabinose transferase-like glycosyltransferase
VPPRPASARSPGPAAGDGTRPGGWRHSYRLGLLLILAVQSALALRLIWSNTAFQDEAEYLWYGHLEWSHWLHGTPLPFYSLSGAPIVYPPLGAVADSLGGLAGARLLSLAFMLGATTLLYATASRLFGRRAGLIAAAVFVGVGPTSDMSAWATYDPMAIFLLALSSWLAVRAARSRVSELWIILAAAAMVLTDAAKWAAALWNPVVVALIMVTAPSGWALAVARGGRLVGYAVGIAVPALFLLGGKSYLHQITTSTTQRGAGATSPLAVLWNAAPLLAVILPLALLAVAMTWREHARRQALICAVLAGALLIAPAVQAHDHTTVSLYKHIDFGAWFGAIGAGYALSRAAIVNVARGWRVGIGAAVFTALVGYGQASGLYGFWPNSAPLMAAVERSLPVRGPMLMEDGDQSVAYYYLFKIGIEPQILTSYSTPASVISTMIQDRYLGMIEMDTGTGIPPGSLQQSIANNPRALEQAGYRRLARIPWRDPNGARGWYTIWVLSARAT